MISEGRQEEAALYALGLLDADAADGFERAQAAEPALRELARDFREAAAAVVRMDLASVPPPPRVRDRLLDRAGAESARPARGKIIQMTWIPWAAAAALAVCCGLLAAREGDLRSELAGVRRLAVTTPIAPLEQITFCSLEPTPEARPEPRAAIAWDASRREGIVHLNHLSPPESGKDYQLWVVEEGVKKPVSAGVVHVDAAGSGRALFKPVSDRPQTAQAFALSLEEAGGVPEGKGPIVLLGKL